MKKLNNFSEDKFLKTLFGFFGCFFVLAAFFMPDRGNMLPGLVQILTQPCKISTSWFAVGGYAATFLNMGLVTLLCLALLVAYGATATNVTTLAVILTLGFASWGIHVLNMWPSIFGVWLWVVVKKEKMSKYVNAMMFSTGIAPLISELMLRYPNAETVGFNAVGILLAILVGLFIGFMVPDGLVHAPKVHKGFDLYSAAVPVGMLAFFLQATLYKTMGVALPAAPAADTLKIASAPIANIFCLILFGLCVVAALAMGCQGRDYWKLISGSEYVGSLSSAKGNAMLLMNVGVYGLFILAYYNLIGGTFNGVTFGIMFCMLATCNSGSHPGNVWPIMVGYFVASFVCGFFSGLAGGAFAGAINAQTIMVGLCYANGLSPISGKYGWHWGIGAGAAHYILVTSVPNMHGGFCLYNGGFTAALICLLFVPVLENLTKTKQERLAAKK